MSTAPHPMRSLDWRVVLPIDLPVERAVLLGADEATLEAARRVGLGLIVGPDLPGVGPVDLVVVDGPGTIDVSAIAARLRPGGVLAWMVDWRRAGQRGLTAARLRKDVHRVGLTGAVSYWIATTPGSPTQRFLPLDAPGATRWYLQAMAGRRDPLRDGARRLLRLSAASPSVLAAIAPRHFTVAARPVDGGSGDEGLLSAAGFTGAFPAVMSGGDRDWSRIAVFPFTRRGTIPGAVIKVPRTPAMAAATRHEQDELARLHRELPPDLAAAVPLPIASPPFAGAIAAVQQYLGGTPVGADDGAIAAAMTWLARAGLATTAEHISAADLAADPRVGGRLDAYLDTIASDAPIAMLFDRVMATARAGPAAWPVGLRHLDFGPWNLRLGEGGIVIHDWERAGIGPLGTDAIFLLAHHAARSPAADGDGPALAAPWVDPGRAGRGLLITRQLSDRYRDAVGIHPTLLPLLVVTTFVEQALERRDRLAETGATPVIDASDRRYEKVVDRIAHSDPAWIANLTRLGPPTGHLPA